MIGHQSCGLIGNTNNTIPGMRKLRPRDSLCTSEEYIETMILSYNIKPQQNLVSLSVSSFHSLVITIMLGTRHDDVLAALLGTLNNFIINR